MDTFEDSLTALEANVSQRLCRIEKRLESWEQMINKFQDSLSTKEGNMSQGFWQIKHRLETWETMVIPSRLFQAQCVILRKYYSYTNDQQIGDNVFTYP